MRTSSFQSLSNWGGYPTLNAQVYTPDTIENAQTAVAQSTIILARGNGRCYGDAALSEQVLSTLALHRVLHFDTDTGLLRCEAGVLLADLLPIIVPKGWFFAVTPGTKYITVGGAIAADVHGKNHPTMGCFSRWLRSFVLIDADGNLRTCSRSEHTALFWQTCGGMGWTGIIVEATFQLVRLPSCTIRQTTVRTQSLEALLAAFEQYSTLPYAAGWMDVGSTGEAFGRGALFVAEHIAVEGEPVEAYTAPRPASIPFYAPNWLLNAKSIGWFNAFQYRKAAPRTHLVSLDAYFYPLDRLDHWNRLYGRRGLVQYQFCMPEANAAEGLAKVLEQLRTARDRAFLTVLKRHGEKPAEAIHSFPIKGYSLALDFPRTPTVFDLVRQLDTIVYRFGGKVYLAKDCCSDPRLARLSPNTFGHPKFQSQMRQRLSINI